MLVFFLISVLGGLLKFYIAYNSDDVELIDVIALLYAIVIFIVMLIYYFNTGEDPLEHL